MLFKEIFNEAFLTEAKIRKQLRLFYEINLSLIKKEKAPEQPAAPQDQSQPEQSSSQLVAPEQPAAPQNSVQPEQPQPPENPLAGGLSGTLSSIVTEDEITDENKIVRKFKGDFDVSEDHADKIQCVDDIIDILEDHKKDGEKILDELCVEVLRALPNGNVQKLDELIDKNKSYIFVELVYGNKRKSAIKNAEKDNSVGVRFQKRKGSDLLTSTMLIDDEIIPGRFNISKVNERIVDFRNIYAEEN